MSRLNEFSVAYLWHDIFLLSMSSKIIVVANWKMNPPTFREAKRIFDATKKAVDKAPNVFVIVTPPSIFLRDLAKSYKGKRIAFAPQNVHWLPGGARTGEISISQAADASASYILIGHSERREMGETNEDTGKKVAATLEKKLIPILCVGERERTKNGEHFGIVKEQLRAALAEILPSRISRMIIAYEPVWAIGGEITMSPREMHEMAIFIRKSIVETHGRSGQSVKILYGASVGEKNAQAMLSEAPVSGFVVGHVSIDPSRFTAMLKSIAR